MRRPWLEGWMNLLKWGALPVPMEARGQQVEKGVAGVTPCLAHYSTMVP